MTFKDIIKSFYFDVKKWAIYQKNKSYLVKNPLHNDVYIVEFPKSGMTWLRTILGNLFTAEEIKITSFNRNQYMPTLEINYFNNVSSINNLGFRIISTHSPFCALYNHVIYLVRNPFSVMQSYFYYMLEIKNINFSIDSFIKSRYGISSWKRHVDQWIERSMTWQSLIVIKFEDLKSCPIETVSNIVYHLGLKDKYTNVEIMKAIELSGFQEMKADQDRYQNSFYYKEKINFIRKGSISADLNNEQKNYILNVAGEIISRIYSDDEMNNF